MAGLGGVVLVCTAHRRPEYLTRTLASWARARGAARLGGLVFALGRSEAEERQAEIMQMTALAIGASGRSVIRRDSPQAQASPGMHRALGEALDWVRGNHPGLEAVICAEEDVVVSDDVLEYLAWALAEFAGDETVAAVCAHDVGGQGWDIPGIGQQGLGAAQDQVRLRSYFNPWVWATWAGPRLDFLLGGWDWDAAAGAHPGQRGYDWQILRLVRGSGLSCVVPEASRSQNIGRDGGYYARPELFDQTQSASFRRRRDPLAYKLIGEHP